MCKAGRIAEAYDLARADCDAAPDNVWAQREMGWALYYMIKDDVERNDKQLFYTHLEELSQLSLLNKNDDAFIFDNLVWKLTEVVRHIPADRPYELDRLFSLISRFDFSPSNGYSFLLKLILGFDTWSSLVEFFEWWNIDKLMPEDYHPFQMDNGKKVMALAEQTYIAYSKALLKLNDSDKIRGFVPKIEKLVDDYPDMMYPGYFCGKLLLAMGAEREDALNIVMPFVRKKKTEFWVWQLLAEIYKDDKDIQLACLLRAVHCRTQETFLGKVRMKLVSVYAQRRDYARAKYHLDLMTSCYLEQGWRLPYEAQSWMRETWVNTVQSDATDGLDYRQYTDAILARGAKQSIAVVTYVDMTRKRASLIYGERKRVNVPLSNLGLKVKDGTLLELKWFPGNDEGIVVAAAKFADKDALKGVSHIRLIKGKISKRDNQAFAFVNGGDVQCFIKPEIVQKQNIRNNDEVMVLAVLDYNKGKNSWNWTAVSLTR